MDSENKHGNKSCTEPARNPWGYLVCFGTIITIVAGIGHVNSFGLIYHEFIIDTGSSAKSLTTAHGVFGIMLAFGGLILNVLAKRYPLRLAGYLGASLLSIGSMLTVVITNTNQLPLTFGVLQGIGMGILVPVCYSKINLYFLKRRTVAMSACKAIQGIVFMWYPQLIKLLMSYYGFRGTLLILTGISLHAFPGMATMKSRDVRCRKRIAEANVTGQLPENIDLLEEPPCDRDVTQSSEAKSKRIWLDIMEFLNIRVWKDPVYCNICVGQSFTNFSDLTFFMLHPMLLFQYGLDVGSVAMCISIGACADVAGRCGLGVISYMMHLNTRFVFFMATLFTLLFRIVLLHVRQFIWVALVTGALGSLRALLHVTSPLVIANHVSHEQFSGAYATFMLATGIVQVVCAPLVGVIKDAFEDYIPAFYILAMCCLPCLVFWPIEYILMKK